MNAGDDLLAPDMSADAATAPLLDRADQGEAVRQVDSERLQPPDAMGQLRDATDEQDVRVNPCAAASSDASPAQSCSLTLLDVALEWRKLPPRSAEPELALLRACHLRAHGPECDCSAKDKPPRTDRSWQNAIRSMIRDRAQPSDVKRDQWGRTPFTFFDRHTGAAGTPSPFPQTESTVIRPQAVDPAAAAAAASEQLPLYLRRGQGPPTITHWNPLGEICLPFLFCFFYLSVRLTVSLFLSLFLFFFLYLSVSLSFSLSLSLSLYLPACQHLLRGNCPWGLLTFS